MAASSLLLVVILSVSLEAEDFGVYSGVVALIAILGAIARLGAAEVMLEDLARRPDEQQEAFGRAIATTTAASVVGVVIATLFGLVILPAVPLFFIVTMAVGELLFVVGNDVTQRFLHAHDRFRGASIAAIASILIRLIAVGSLLVIPMQSIEDLGIRFMVSGLVAWMLGIAVVVSVSGRPQLSLPSTFAEVRRGAVISVGATSHLIAARMDQTLLLRAGLDQQAGIYGLAARVVFNAMMPAQTLRAVFHPDHFREGAKSIDRASDLTRKLVKPLAAYGAFATAVILAIAPFVQRLLDESYEGVMWVLILMSLMPPIRIMQSLVGDILTVTGFHETKSRATIISASSNVAMNLAFIPFWGWRGALAATYVSETCLLIAFTLLVRARLRGEREDLGEKQNEPVA